MDTDISLEVIIHYMSECKEHSEGKACEICSKHSFGKSFYKKYYLDNLKIDNIILDDSFDHWEDLIKYVVATNDLRKSKSFVNIYNNVINFKSLPKKMVSIRGRFTTTTYRDITNFLPPYSFEEVHSFEQKNGINLPLELKIYLIEISKTVFKERGFHIMELNPSSFLSKPFPWINDFGLLPSKNCVDLNYDRKYLEKNLPQKNISSMNDNDLLNFMRNELCFKYTPSQIHYLKISDYLQQDFDLTNSFFQGTLQILSINRNWNEFIVLNGAYVGTIWRYEIRSMDKVYKSYNGFFDYILHQNQDRNARVYEFIDMLQINVN